MAINKNQIAIAGEFAALSQLAARGYDANMTLGNTKSVDILVSKPEGEMYKLEVKTSRYNEKPSRSELFGLNFKWQLDEKNESIVDPKLFYCFVNMNLDTKGLRFFIVPSKIVAKFLKDSHNLYRKEKPKNKNTSRRYFMLGFKNESYKIIDTPLTEDWEDNWKFETLNKNKQLSY